MPTTHGLEPVLEAYFATREALEGAIPRQRGGEHDADPQVLDRLLSTYGGSTLVGLAVLEAFVDHERTVIEKEQ